MREILLSGGPFTGRMAHISYFDGTLNRFVMLWRMNPIGQQRLTEWACLYHADGRYDRTLEGADAEPYFRRSD